MLLIKYSTVLCLAMLLAVAGCNTKTKIKKLSKKKTRRKRVFSPTGYYSCFFPTLIISGEYCDNDTPPYLGQPDELPLLFQWDE